jgi:hypothetical protein
VLETIASVIEFAGSATELESSEPFTVN